MQLYAHVNYSLRTDVRKGSPMEGITGLAVLKDLKGCSGDAQSMHVRTFIHVFSYMWTSS